MQGVHNNLIVPLGGIDLVPMLEFWHWPLPDSLRPWFATAPIVTHSRVWGPIHEKLKDLPDGTRVEVITD